MQLGLEGREKHIFGGLDRLKSFRLPVNRWVEGSAGVVTFEHSGGVEEGSSDRAADKVSKGGLRTKSALDIIVMPNVDLDTVEGVMARELVGSQTPFETIPGYARHTVEAMSKYG